MKIEVAADDLRMTSSGKGILRSLQNDNLPYIDLVIREAFQNSLDAALPNVDAVKIGVDIKKFSTNKLSPVLEGVTETLNNKYSEIEQAMIISDKNTIGLQGEFNTNSPEVLKKSNIHKLIYGISMNQEAAGAGGSWGLGKTSYFRIGTGIVIYYTRIKLDDGSFAERLAASLIENEDNPDKLLKNSSRGLAWWGAKDSDNQHSYPITDSNEISDILKIFDITPYAGDETGTCIIIPFIDESLLVPEKDELEECRYSFDGSITEQVKLAIQRWYGPRIENGEYLNHFNQAVLLPSVNGERIEQIKFLPVFKWMSELYGSALTGNAVNDKIIVKPVTGLRLAMEQTSDLVGRVAYAVLNSADLQMGAPDNFYSPLSYLNISAKDKIEKGTSKILAYSRKPAMVVEYDIDGSWTTGLSVPDNSYLLAFFVPNSDGKIHHNFQGHYTTLDDYLRDTENADHANWKDKHVEGSKVSIVERTKKEIIKQIQSELNPQEEAGIMSAKTTLIAKKFGSKLLPPSNFGKRSNRVDGTVRKGTDLNSAKNKLSTVKVLDVSPNKELLEVEFELINKTRVNNLLYFAVVTQESSLDEKSWTKKMDKSVPYPFEVKSLVIDRVNDMQLTHPRMLEDFKITISKSGQSEEMVAAININVGSENGVTIKGSILLEVKDPYLSPVLSVKSLNIEE